eukprot:9187689-Pyramimonas_sp.AAC.1
MVQKRPKRWCKSDPKDGTNAAPLLTNRSWIATTKTLLVVLVANGSYCACRHNGCAILDGRIGG